MTQDLVANLARALRAEVVETHISWVLLAGDLAYKIKKPVRLPFVDYSTLEARRHFCEEEVRLNSRLAPNLYLGVSSIVGTLEAPELDKAGAPIEFAVRMRRFATDALFSEKLAASALRPFEVDAISALLARFHMGAGRAPTAYSNPVRRRSVAHAALEGACPCASGAEQSTLRAWIETEADKLEPFWHERVREGFVRECHGDLHLDNIVTLDEGVAAFDCIEFDAALRFIDIMDDVAFPVMDFAARGHRGFAFRLLNGWLDRTGDYGGIAGLAFASVYRALVRAQVAHLRGAANEAVARRYVEAALSWTRPAVPRLFITHGLPGSGKTFQSQLLLEREGAVRLRSDVERKRLFGLGMLDDSRAKRVAMYTKEATNRTYEHLLLMARTGLQAGYPVVLDAAFLQRSERAAAHNLAVALGVPFGIVACDAPSQVLRERLLARKDDASEADPSVLELLSGNAEPLTESEREFVVSAEVDAGSSPA